MNRYQKMFKHLYQNKSGAFVPFITLGDPDPICFMRIIDTLIKSGVDALELGVPFSDPVSDGLSIQKSMIRASSSGMNIFHCLKLIQTIRNKYVSLPIGLLIYANLIFRYGIKNFYNHCEKLNIDSILIPDLPIEESALFYNTATSYKIAHIFICPPNATTDLIQNIVFQGNGYIYLLSRPGVTGINKVEFKTNILNNLIYQIKRQKRILPILQGFGIYSPEQAKQSLLSGTSGVIIGSAIADLIENNHTNMKLLLKKIQQLVHEMKKSMCF